MASLFDLEALGRLEVYFLSLQLSFFSTSHLIPFRCPRGLVRPRPYPLQKIDTILVIFRYLVVFTLFFLVY